jgi:hypothetical protein
VEPLNNLEKLQIKAFSSTSRHLEVNSPSMLDKDKFKQNQTFRMKRGDVITPQKLVRFSDKGLKLIIPTKGSSSSRHKS